MTYQVLRKTNCNYWITKNDHKVFDLRYPSLLSNEAYGDVDDCSYYIEKESIWSCRFKISKGKRTIGHMSYNWRGHITLDLVDRTGQFFEIKLKYRGLLKPRLEVWQDNHTHLFTMYGIYRNWGAYLDYEIEKYHELEADFPEEELVGLLTHGACYYMQMSGMT